MKHIYCSLFFLFFSALTYGQETFSIDFANFYTSGFDANNCTYTINGVPLAFYDIYNDNAPVCSDPSNSSEIFPAFGVIFSASDLPFTGTTVLMDLGPDFCGTLDFATTVVTYSSGVVLSFEGFPVEIDDFSLVSTISIEEVECGFAFGAPAPPLNNGELNAPPSALESYLLTFSGIQPLPVAWSSVSGSRTKQEVRIEWSTQSESANKEFVVQSSDDGAGWIDRSVVPATGNSSGGDYETTFEDALNHEFYRIKQIDFDGSFQFSDVFTIELINQREGTIAVVDASSRLRLLQPVDNLTIVDLSGRVLLNEPRPNDVIDFYSVVGKRAPGIYFLVAREGETTNYQKIFIP